MQFRAFAFDPNNPAYVPPDRVSDGSLTPLLGSDPTVTYTVSGLPAGATFDPDTAMFFWEAGYNDAGTYQVTFTATNDGDGTGVPLGFHGDRADHRAERQSPAGRCSQSTTRSMEPRSRRWTFP